MKFFTSVFFTINSVLYSIGLACEFQLAFFSSFMLFGICIIFITSVSYLITYSLYIIILLYGSVLCISLLFRYIVFSKEYITKSFTTYTFWKLRYNPHLQHTISPELLTAFKQYKIPKADSFMSGLVRILLLITDNVSLFMISIIIALLVGWGICIGYNGIMTNALGYTYLIYGWASLMIYFVMTVLIDFTVTFMKKIHERESVEWLEMIITLLPCGFVYSILRPVIRKTKKKVRILIKISSILILSYMFVTFIISLIIVTIDSNTNGTTLTLYWFFFFIAVVSGLIPAQRVLQLSKTPSSYSLLNTQEPHEVQPTILPPTTTIQETSSDDDIGMSSIPEYNPTSKKELLFQLHQRLFNYQYESSTVLVVLFTLLFGGLLLFEASSLSYLFANTPQNQDLTIDLSNGSTSDYLSSFNDLNVFNHHSSQDLKGYYKSAANISDDVLQYSHLCANDPYGISMQEYGYLSYMAYARSNTENDAYSFISSLLQNKGWNLSYHVEQSSLYYLIAENNLLDVNVIAFRGTYSLVDCIHDLQLFLESALPELSVSIFPVFTEQVLSWISYVVSYFGSQAFPRGSLYMIDIAKNVVENEIRSTSRSVVLCGHSLGGGIANIIGSDVELNNIGISPPGIYLGRRSLGLSKQNLMSLTRAIVPERDPVAALGTSAGSTFTIPCYTNSAKCHDLQNSLCMIGALCHVSEMLPLCVGEWKDWKFDYTNW
ncbi:Fungal lipase-type domain-containing protein [Entamoeba marina]